MNKYIVLLIIPFLLFHVGCEKDQDNEQENNTPIPVSQYPESILGHWKCDQTERTQTYKYIDPIYGTEIIDTIIETITVYPKTLDGKEYLVEDWYETYKYDETGDDDKFIFDSKDLNTPVDHNRTVFDYTINENTILYEWYYPEYIIVGVDTIIQLTDTSLERFYEWDQSWEEGDTTYWMNTIVNIYMSRVEELPPTPRSSTQQLKRTVDILGREIKLRPSH